MQRTADYVVGILEQFSSAKQFLRAALLNEERDACKGAVLVRRLIGKIVEDVFVERRLVYHISVIGRGVIVAVDFVNLLMFLSFLGAFREPVRLLMMMLLLVSVLEPVWLLIFLLSLLE